MSQQTTRLYASISTVSFILFLLAAKSCININFFYRTTFTASGCTTTMSKDLPKESKIPRIIHQTWKVSTLPVIYKDWVDSWCKYNPGWIYWLWTDESMRQMIALNYPSYLDMYDSYPSGVHRADAFRYFVLFHYGGVYADLDVESLKSMESIIQKYDCIIGTEPYEHARLLYNRDYLVSNALMACKANHTFFRHLTKTLLKTRSFKDPIHATGPFMVQRGYDDSNSTEKKSLTLAEPNLFLPTFDNDRLSELKRICTHRVDSKKYTLTCRKLIARNYNNTVMPISITNHHWSHSYFHKRILSKECVLRMYAVMLIFLLAVCISTKYIKEAAKHRRFMAYR